MARRRPSSRRRSPPAITSSRSTATPGLRPWSPPATASTPAASTSATTRGASGTTPMAPTAATRIPTPYPSCSSCRTPPPPPAATAPPSRRSSCSACSTRRRTYRSSVHSFPSSDGFKNWGFLRFITHGDLDKSEHLVDDGFAVRCDVTVMGGIELRVEPASLLAVPEPDLHRHLGRLLSTGDGADVTFRVAGGEAFAAHRCVLAARSPVFRAELYSRGGFLRPAAAGRPETRVVDVDDMDAGAFRALLHFVYTDTLPEMA
ncbi:Os11g0630900 [Oryza sativa Japonica Group]|uniref:BTB/POZ domain containing protein, expressed n=2 Tax=Oryza sativa subsp. japonica TaxID=39947 RepID=Q2R0V4_ORYSJ|nr:BTB/POZ domain containing protein, expressed [Oryza sativa Japonica Group]USI00910.1 Bric-a-Brac, Tramtrack, Broad Complex BTB domain protein MrBTB5 [Oryza sativa Japonica Group]BAG98060.1 unnamed protein product [Oryza sativa Japonica Group]BAH95397.1 Os11g0630900 [Oryza sativa Japonica Group]|eukprot:NP_001176669.1 Os11g0630900 [Oryza sativa Japonica Group]